MAMAELRGCMPHLVRQNESPDGRGVQHVHHGEEEGGEGNGPFSSTDSTSSFPRISWGARSMTTGNIIIEVLGNFLSYLLLCA